MTEGANMVTDSGTATQPQYVTAEQLQQFSEKIGNDLKAMLGRVPNIVADQVAGLAKTQPIADSKKDSAQATNPNEEVARILKAEREELQKEKQAIQRQKIRGTIENLLVENGANHSAVKLATDSLMMRNSDKISVVSNMDTGEQSIVYKPDQYSDGMPMSEFIKGFLQGDEGRAIVAQKTPPSVGGIPRGAAPIGGEVIKMTRAQMATADPKLLLSGRVVAID